MSFLFRKCYSLSVLPDISKWNTHKVKDMRVMFGYYYSENVFFKIFDKQIGCKSLKSLPDISKWYTQNVNNIEKMFTRCKHSLSIPKKFKQGCFIF